MKAHILLTALLVFSTSALQADIGNKKLYEDLVVPVLSAKCASCHGEEKQKGKLRVDTIEAILKGGNEGALVVAGKLNESPLIQRVYLPLDDDEHMPPEGKDQLTPEETALLAFWITSGVKQGVTVNELKPDKDASAAIAHVVGNLPAAPLAAAKKEAAPVLDEAQIKIVEETIGRVQETGASLMPIAQDTPELRFSALNVSKEFSDDGLTALKPVSPHVRWVDLARTQVTDAGLGHLSGMKNITRLHLENTKITDAGLVHLAGLTNLEYLNLYGTQVTDAGIAKLSGLKNLKKIFLWQSKVSESGAQKLAAAIPGLDANTGWKASNVEPVALVAKAEKPAPPAPKPATKPAPAPKPAAPAKTEPKPAPSNPLFDKAIAELKTASSAADQKAAKAKADFDAAIREVDAVTKKAQALKGESEKADLIAKEAKAALNQLLKASKAGQ